MSFKCTTQQLGIYINYKVFIPVSLLPNWHYYSYYNITDYIPCSVLYIPIDYFVTANLYMLIPSPLSPSPHPTPTSGN